MYTKFKVEDYLILFKHLCSIEETQMLIFDALKPLGNQYLNVVKNIFNEELISWLPKPNKSKRSFCKTVNNGRRSYISINFNGSIQSVIELIHEIGHAVESYFVMMIASILTASLKTSA